MYVISMNFVYSELDSYERERDGPNICILWHISRKLEFRQKEHSVLTLNQAECDNLLNTSNTLYLGTIHTCENETESLGTGGYWWYWREYANTLYVVE